MIQSRRAALHFSAALKLLLMSVVFATAADARSVRRLVFESVLSEEIDPSIPVNGESGAIGLAAAADKAKRANQNDVWIEIPEDLSGPVLLKITDIDGRYLGAFRYRAIAGPRRWERVRIRAGSRAVQSRRNAALKQYSRDQLAYAISPMAGAPERGAPLLLVASKNPNQHRKQKTSVLVNSLGAEEVFYRLSDSQTREPCQRVSGRPTRFYDYSCEVPLDALVAQDDTARTVKITRVLGANVLDPIVVRIR